MARPLSAAGGVMTAVHQAVELGLGTGVIGQSRIGLGGAIASSVLMDAGWVAVGRRGRADRLLAFLSGVAIGVPAIHFTLWPWRVARGIPVLTEAEGLPERVMPLYNAILYGWAAAGAAALVVETPPARRRWALAGLGSVVAFRPVARAHFAWMAEEAKRNRRWWNRAWA